MKLEHRHPQPRHDRHNLLVTGPTPTCHTFRQTCNRPSTWARPSGVPASGGDRQTNLNLRLISDLFAAISRIFTSLPPTWVPDRVNMGTNSAKPSIWSLIGTSEDGPCCCPSGPSSAPLQFHFHVMQERTYDLADQLPSNCHFSHFLLPWEFGVNLTLR